ncbi:Innexin unc-9 [Echinococcus granulosus]|uniref:Innexin n=1 Tax=Echinococcus granulosus TaxID=6210 RepID=W6ULF0_ECHGR|nr:Innexin unc-9 [Echinococcus granulosus]EUB62350.1 Innexin unc-9 [Echinococcus granulosus]
MDTHFFAGLTKFKLDAGKHRRDDDFADRFSHNFTTLLLVIFTLVVSARQYIGKPIACWVPTEFTRAQEEYAESVCWVTSTYFLPTKQKTVPESTQEREERKILYYQWVPFVLMIQAFLFNLPCIIWRLFNWQSGIHIIRSMAFETQVQASRRDHAEHSLIYTTREFFEVDAHVSSTLMLSRET